jgi:autotransporter-associated beta strand protein
MLYRWWYKLVTRLVSRQLQSASRAVAGASRRLLHLEAVEERLTPSTSPIASPAHVLPVHHGAPMQSSSPVGYIPSQILAAYGINQVQFGSVAGNGAGQTIALVEAYDDPAIAGDLAHFDSTLGIPAPPSFTKVAQDGSQHFPATDPTDNWPLEEDLDVEWAHALAPAANILVVEANSDSFDDLNTAIDYARNQTGVCVVSMSFGGPEYSGDPGNDGLFTTPAGHAGVTFVASAGDSAAPGDYPAYSPNVLAVGGTALTLNGNSYKSETAWSGSGGGVSVFEGQPAYQKVVVTQSNTRRTMPDVAFDASTNTGVAVYDSFDYGSSTPWTDVGGTSIGAPCWSALIAITNQGRALNGLGALDSFQQTLTRLYQLQASDFHDITSGSNGHPAGPGYDLVTGLGSPVANLLVPDLALAYTPATLSWTGGGATSNWSDPNNWGGTAPHPGDNLVFGPGPANLTPYDDFPIGTLFNSITFSGSGYVVNGNSIVTELIDGSNASGANTLNLNLTLGNAGTINAGSSSTTLTLTGTINASGFDLAIGGGAGAVTLTGTLNGTAGLIDDSSGVVTFQAATTFSSLALSGGTLTTGTGTLTLTGDVFASGSSSISGNLVLGTAVSNVTVSSSSTLAVGAAISGAGSLSKAGSGTLALSGVNSYTGNTTLSAGTLVVSNGSALGTGTLTLVGSTTLQASVALSLANAVKLGGTVTISAGSNLTLSGPVTLTGNSTLSVGSGLMLTLSGEVGQSGGSLSLTKTGAGTLVLSGTGSYGSTVLSAGTLTVGSGNALGSGALTLTSGIFQAGSTPLSLINATMLRNVTIGGGYNVTFTGPVSASGTTTVAGSDNLSLSGPVTLTGNWTVSAGAGLVTTLSGAVGQTGGNWSLTKSGLGTLVLSGTGSYGSSVLTAGTLTVGNGNALGTGALTLTGGTFQAGGAPLSLANALTLANVTIGGGYNVTFTGPVSASGATTVAGSDNLTLAGPVTMTGNWTVSVGAGLTTALAGNVGQAGGNGTLTKTGAGTLIFYGTNANAATTLSQGVLAVDKANTLGNGVLTMNGGTFQANSASLVLANAVNLGSAAIGGNYNLAFTGPVTLTGNPVQAGSDNFTLAGPITLTGNRTISCNAPHVLTFSGAIGESGGPRSLTKTGSGTLILSGNNTYSGGTVLSAGILSVDNASAIGSGTLALNGGTLQANSTAISLVNPVTLGGNATIGGSYDVTLTGAVTLTGGRTLTVSNTALTTIAGSIGQSSSAMALTTAGSGTLVLSGSNTYTGGTTVSSGTLLVNGTQASGTVNVKSGAALGGSGTIGVLYVWAGGIVLPGTSSSATGSLSSGNITFTSGLSFNVALNGATAGSGFAQLVAAGTVNLGGSTLNVLLGFSPPVGTNFTIIKNNGSAVISGTFGGLAQGATFAVNGMTFQINYTGGGGHDVVITRTG